MQRDMAAGCTAATGCGDDTAVHCEEASLSRPAREDDRLERDEERPDAGPRESERLFRATFERAVFGIAHVGPQGRWLRVNRRLCDLLGYGREELAARTWQDLTHPDDLDADLAQHLRLLAGEIEEYATDKRYVRRDGATVWVHVTVSLVRTPAGAPDYFITMVQDITKQKRLEQDRAQLLQRERAARAEAEATNARLGALQALTDAALSHLGLDDLLRELLGRLVAVLGVDHVAIFLLDDDGRTLTLRAGHGPGEGHVGWVRVQMGPGFTGRVAASRAPLIVDDLAAFDVEGVHPTLRETARSAVGVPLLVADHAEGRGEGKLEGGVAAGHPGEAGQLVGVLFVGSAAPRRFTEADVQLLQRAADRVALAVDRARLYAAEREARTRAEAALARAVASEAEARERAARLNAILETMADGVAVYDAEGRPVQLVNRAYRELYAVERAPAGYDALTTDERARLLDLRDAATGAPLPFERTPAGRALRGEVVTGPGADIRARAFDGRELEVNSSAAPLRDGDGRVVGAVLVLRDVTERNHLAREREAALARARASEAEARERAARLNAILETMADGVAVYDAEGRPVQLVNRAYRELYAVERAPAGYDALSVRDRVRLLQVRDAATGAPLPFAETPAGRALRGEVVTGPGADIRARAFDGRELEVNNSAAPLRDGDGRVVGAVLLLRDVTWRRRLEREREAARARAERQAEQLDRIFEAVADGLLVWDAAGRLVRENPAARRILGLDAAPPGYSQLPLHERLARYAARDERGRPMPLDEWPVTRTLGAAVGNGKETGTGIGPEVHDIQLRALDGREIELRIAAAPLRDREGRLVGAVSVLHDQTERNRLAREREAARAVAEAARARAVASEARAAERAEQLRTILETMADGVAVYDTEGRIIQMNRAYRELYAVERAPAGYETLSVGDRARALDLRDGATGAPLPPEGIPVARALRGEVVTGPAADVRTRAFDGRELEANDSAAPLRDGDGRVVGAVLLLRDMTERNRLAREREAARADELAAREASRRLEQFLAVAAHDLRTPLAAAVGFLDLAGRQAERLATAAARGEGPDLMRQVAAVRDRLDDAGQGVERLARLLSRLFDTAAIRAGKLELRRAPCDLAALVREQVAGLRVAAPGRVIRLREPAGGAPVPVEADADRIAEVVANYMTNALKYSPPDRPVDVDVEVRGARARVAVRDLGPGIPEGERARVWELFHRAPGVAAQDGAHGGSLGLGLHISKAIVAAHGGRVGVRSVVGCGSTFWFTLPLSGPLSGSAGAAPRPEA